MIIEGEQGKTLKRFDCGVKFEAVRDFCVIFLELANRLIMEWCFESSLLRGISKLKLRGCYIDNFRVFRNIFWVYLSKKIFFS